MPSFRRSLLLAALAMASSFASSAATLSDSSYLGSLPYQAPHDVMNGDLAVVEVLAPRSDRHFLMFESRDRQVYVAGESGQPYVLKVRNRTNERILVVPSVDGVNAITGQTASSRQSGYIVPPYGEVVIDGWRKSTREVAEFVFTAQSDSYATQTGRPANVGVIGLAVFREERPTPRDDRGGRYFEKSSRSGLGSGPVAPAAPAPVQGAGISADAANSSAPAMKARPAEAEERLGTGHGQRQDSAIQYGEFRREPGGPAELLQLRYDSLRNLENSGIVLRKPVRVRPQPFPNDGFVPDPPRR